MSARFRIVPARAEHHAEFTRFLAELGTRDPVPEPERWAREMAPHTFFLADADAEHEEQLVGYAFVEVFAEVGYIRHVVVAPGARGRGVGSALMRAIATRLRERGCLRWELNVKPDNAPAVALYERWGMRTVYSTSVVRLPWERVVRLPASARALAVRGVDPDADAGIERAFHLPDGKVARLRSLTGMRLVQLVEQSVTVAFARFDPAYPGCFPFRVGSPDLARALLEGVRPHARTEDEWIQLVIERDAATAESMLAVGAQLVFEIVHMEGAILAKE